MRSFRAAAVGLALAACQKEPTGTVAGPPLTIAHDAGPSATDAGLATPAFEPPVKASFVDVGASTPPVAAGPCDRVYVHVARGKVDVAGESLSPGDTVVVSATPSVPLRGAGVAVVVLAPRTPCPTTPGKTVVKGTVAPRLSWAFGTMSAHLDVGPPVSPDVYLGRLEGTAAVAEHVHATSWEILCALEARGTFTLAGKERRLGDREIVVVPPDTKHAWKPDPGATLVGVQIYDPPGPEQRFKLLAEQADAGPR